MNYHPIDEIWMKDAIKTLYRDSIDLFNKGNHRSILEAAYDLVNAYKEIHFGVMEFHGRTTENNNPVE